MRSKFYYHVEPDRPKTVILSDSEESLPVKMA